MTDDIGGTGLTIDDLSDYLDSGRLPRNPVIENNAECRQVLADLERLGALSRELVIEEATDAAASAAWFDRVMSTIATEVRAGRDVPFATEPGLEVVITEGAIRSAIRAAGDSVPGALVGRTRIDGDVEVPGSPVTVRLSIAVIFGEPLPLVTAAVREAVADALRRLTPLQVVEIDIVVDDVLDEALDDASARPLGDSGQTPWEGAL
jgi:uncharacterized alkaline shock family protein YloU